MTVQIDLSACDAARVLFLVLRRVDRNAPADELIKAMPLLQQRPEVAHYATLADFRPFSGAFGRDDVLRFNDVFRAARASTGGDPFLRAPLAILVHDLAANPTLTELVRTAQANTDAVASFDDPVAAWVHVAGHRPMSAKARAALGLSWIGRLGL